jgi:hypothetical protein
LSIWFNTQATEKEKTLFKDLLATDQIEISNGASVASHDEATTYYLDIVDNYRAGA